MTSCENEKMSRNNHVLPLFHFATPYPPSSLDVARRNFNTATYSHATRLLIPLAIGLHAPRMHSHNVIMLMANTAEGRRYLDVPMSHYGRQ